MWQRITTDETLAELLMEHGYLVNRNTTAGGKHLVHLTPRVQQCKRVLSINPTNAKDFTRHAEDLHELGQYGLTWRFCTLCLKNAPFSQQQTLHRFMRTDQLI